jgi:hypothetical protein
MKNLTRVLPIALLAFVIAAGSGCILDEKVIQIVLSNEVFADFSENHTGASWTNTEVLDYAGEIDKILKDNGYSRDDIDEAKIVSAFAGVTSYGGTTNWMISGGIEVRRIDGTPGPWATIIDYTNASVPGLLGQKQSADLNTAGVTVLNQALADFIAGQDPVIEFRVVNGDVQPAPSPTNPIVFDWRAWLLFQIVLTEVVEVPDPF